MDQLRANTGESAGLLDYKYSSGGKIVRRVENAGDAYKFSRSYRSAANCRVVHSYIVKRLHAG